MLMRNKSIMKLCAFFGCHFFELENRKRINKRNFSRITAEDKKAFASSMKSYWKSAHHQNSAFDLEFLEVMANRMGQRGTRLEKRKCPGKNETQDFPWQR